MFWWTPTPTGGTRFDILFPRVRQTTEAAKTPVKPGKPLALRGRKILVVDDEPIVRLYFKEVLSLANAQVTACASAAEALEVFRGVPDAFSLVITDLTMPGMSGVEIIREIRASGSQVPVFIYSGYADAVSSQQISELNIANVLLKPVTAEELAEAINSVFSGQAVGKEKFAG